MLVVACVAMKVRATWALWVALLGLGAGCGDDDDGAAGEGGASGSGVAGQAGASAGGKSGAGGAGLSGSSGRAGAAAGHGGASGVGGLAGAGAQGGSAGVGGAAVAGAGGASLAGAGGAMAGAGGGAVVEPTFVERQSLRPADVAILVNTDDPQSVAVGDYYRSARGIPEANVVKLALGAGLGTNVGVDTFKGWKQQIDAATAPGIQAYAVTWTQPSVVDCMSLTSALAFGYDDKWCNKSGQVCGGTASSPYYNAADGTAPVSLGVRPSMVLAGTSVENVKALIDRGVSADATFPTGDGWLITTTDSARSSRSFEFQQTTSLWSDPSVLKLTYVDNSAGKASDIIENQPNVLFYFTGLADVPQIATNTYRPGAIADHLTSYGGQIPNSGQMSILRWIEAGATASFGTVVEPCNYTTKFPDPTVVLDHYYRGETLLEAYWKSVQWPGEGLFIGEPLARPWGTKTSFAAGTLTITTTTMQVGKTYTLESAPSADGPWTTVEGNLSVTSPQPRTLTVANAKAPYYRLSSL